MPYVLNPADSSLSPGGSLRVSVRSFDMLKFSHSLAFLACLSFVAAQSVSSGWLPGSNVQNDSGESNPITQPIGASEIRSGSTYTIFWTPTAGNIISIELQADVPISNIIPGNPCLTPWTGCVEIVSNISNSGSFVWNIPSNAPTSKNYYLDIYVPDPPPGYIFYFMTGNFSINPSAPVQSLTATATSSTTFANPTGSAQSEGSNNSTVSAAGTPPVRRVS
jgi:Kre9/KNH-like N-terminal Ig-like domain